MLPRSLQPAMVKLRRMLFQEGARLSHHDAAAKLHIASRNAREYLNEIRGELRIVDWRREGSRGILAPVYAAGPGDDEPRPATLKEAARERRRLQMAATREAKAKRCRAVKLAVEFHAEPIKLDPLMAAFHRDGSIGRP